MKLQVICTRCFRESGIPPLEWSSADVSDTGVYESICSKGHKTYTALQADRHEILFEIGVRALIDGYYREAITSFSASLERFHEYCTRVLCRKEGLDFGKVNSAWSLVKSQSERQLGAFVFLWLIARKQVPQLIDDKKPMNGKSKAKHTWKEFRNAVVHSGKIPTLNEANIYGELVYDYIVEKLFELKNDCDEQMWQVSDEVYFDAARSIQGEDAPDNISFMAINKSIDRSRPREDHKGFTEAIIRAKTNFSWKTNN